MSLTVLHSQFAYKAWANAELYAFLTQQEQGPLLQTALRTLNHIYVVDKIFQAHLCGQPHPYTFANTDDTPGVADLSWQVHECDAWFITHVSSLTAAQLAEPVRFIFTDGDKGQMSREEILLHVLLHGSYHRGNVGQLFKSVNIAPPRDLYTKFLHQLEPGRRDH
ncbi:MAG: hypothetical protein RLZZ502_1251 [Pseudomonadota bacterium]|jgi:uncharacterized damage-inducible protein DinB